jgi:YaiO family outer membrane protein
MRSSLLLPALLAPFSSAAYAALPSPKAKPNLNLKNVVASVDGEYLSYSGDHGSRRVVNGRTEIRMPSTRVDFRVSQGRRVAGGESFNGVSLQASVGHDWTSNLSTRTAVGIGSNNPVFVNREFVQEVSFKPAQSTLLTVGGRYSRYFGGVDVKSWSAGASQYFPGGYVSYRFTSYDAENIGHSVGHLVSGKLTDPYGSTVAWVGHGTLVSDADWLAAPQKGHQTSIEVHRLQPIGGGVSLSVGARRSWYKTASGDFHGNGVHVGLSFEP